MIGSQRPRHIPRRQHRKLRGPLIYRVYIRILACLFVGLFLASCQTGSAGQSNRAALLVVHSGGETRTACVSFTEPEISGYELLNRSDMPLVVDAGNPMGVMVCSIDGEGCAFPVERCLCECSAPGSCTYWAYFARNPDGSWAYSPNGASARAVSDGDMDAWVWLSGSGPSGPATPPVPETSFEAICR